MIGRLLGRVSMYRLTLTALLVTLVVAVAAAALDQLHYEPLAIVIAAVLASASTLLTSLALGRLRGIRTHAESSVITGLILTFVLWPSLATADLLAIAAAGVVAGASKFLLTYRGRHVVNPAALGALVVTATGLGTSVWWVGNGVLAPVVLIAAAVIAARTQRVSFLLSYALPALGLTTLGYVLAGTSAADALWWSLTSSPVLFLAGFMLSEPLTQPPRRKQRTVVALVVALGSVLPLYLHAAAWMTPELALVIGNVVALAMTRRHRVVLELRSRRVTDEQHELTFAALDSRGRPRPVGALPGQYLEIDLPHRGADARGRRRALSVASDPRDTTVTLITRVPQRPSSFKRALAGLEPGARLQTTGLWGDFVPPADDGPVALVAGGIGITPFLAHLSSDALTSHHDLVLVHAVEDPAHAIAPTSVPAGIQVVVISPTRPAETSPSRRWVAGRLQDPSTLLEAVPDLKNRTVYVSGPPVMVGSVRGIARTAGARKVRTDAFIGC